MKELREILSDDEDFFQLVNIIAHPRAPKTYRNRQNHFEIWNENEFIKRFRLSKNAVRFIIENIENQILSHTDRNHAVSAEEMVLLTLRFLATGAFLQVNADFIGVDKSTASRIVDKVCRAIARLNTTFIKMPQTEEDMQIASQNFYNISRFPKCIGALDCTHVKISSPGGQAPENFRNRKHFFSYNVQIICDANGKIINIVCRWPGSAHDSTIFNNSNVGAEFENNRFNGYVLVGDSGYAVRPYLLTPLLNPLMPAENLYNEAQIRTRNPIERCFGVWKRRFPILAFGICLKPMKVEAVVIATAVLHNIALLFKDPMPPPNEEEQVAIDFADNIPNENIREIGAVNVNNLIRHQFIYYFNELRQ